MRQLPRRFFIGLGLWTAVFMLAFAYDKALMQSVKQDFWPWPTAYVTLRWISHFGEGQYYALSSLILMGWAFWQNRVGRQTPFSEKIGKQSWFFFAVFFLSSLLANILKFIFGRPRPSVADLTAPQDWNWFTFDGHWQSLPSGHAQATMAFALVMSHYFPTYRICWLGWTFCVGMSRFLLTKHFLSDVIAGYAIAWVTYFLLRQALSRKA